MTHPQDLTISLFRANDRRCVTAQELHESYCLMESLVFKPESPRPRAWKEKRRKKIKSMPHPRSAWLLLADEAAYMDDRNLDAVGRGITWTCSPRVKEDDLLFLYYMSPRKSIDFVARSMCSAFFDPERGVNAVRQIRSPQWWFEVGPMVRVDPIPLHDIRRVVDMAWSLRAEPESLFGQVRQMHCLI